MSEKRVSINPANLFDGQSMGISQAVRVGETVYCSGQVAFAETLAEQAEGAFANAQTLLAAAGASMADVVKMTIYTTDPECWPKTKGVRARYLLHPFPAATMVVVRGLASPALMIEVDMTAVVGSGR